jgi:hypothetical protein
MAKLSKKKGGHVSAVAVHGKAKDGTAIVGIGNIRVFIAKYENHWFAQALEIDYAAQGNSLNDVKESFEEGFCATIHEHLKIFGNIEKLLKPAPPEVWAEVFGSGSKLRLYSQLSFHRNLPSMLPFSGVDFIGVPQSSQKEEAVCV